MSPPTPLACGSQGAGAGYVISVRNSLGSGSRSSVKWSGPIWQLGGLVESDPALNRAPLPPPHTKGLSASCVTLGRSPDALSLGLLIWAMGMMNSALKINALMLQMCTYPAQGWAHPGTQCLRLSGGQPGPPLGKDLCLLDPAGFWPGPSLAAATSPPGLISLAARLE